MGTADARAAVKSRVAEGTAAFNERISGSVHLAGAATMLSSGHKFKCAMQFNNPQYRGEQFVYDGRQVQVAMIDPQARSALGNFLLTQTEILEEGLLGGVLSTGWPLPDLKSSGAKLKIDGMKKMEGRELYEATYAPKKSSNSGELLIRLYFEPDTFRHVMTVYKLSATSTAGGYSQASDSSTKTTTVEERFEDFRAVDGVTLPFAWEIRLRIEPSASAQEFQWKIAFTGITHNKLWNRFKETLFIPLVAPALGRRKTLVAQGGSRQARMLPSKAAERRGMCRCP
jgi:hypothetical protein